MTCVLWDRVSLSADPNTTSLTLAIMTSETDSPTKRRFASCMVSCYENACPPGDEVSSVVKDSPNKLIFPLLLFLDLETGSKVHEFADQSSS